MRLIDADKVLGVLRELDTHSFSGTIHIKNAMYLINEQPTVYDVDKVVEQLKERSKEFNSGLRLHGKPEDMLTDEAIEIVKAGGKS
nr:MAG TPA: hypothetical protein [Caudoviricetes sp.]